MILVFGGTTEGRLAAAVLDGAGKPYLYSTLGSLRTLGSPNAVQISGALDEAALVALIEREGVTLVIDAAHPFAMRLHATIDAATRQTGIPVVRVERRYPERSGGVVWCDGYEDAMSKMTGAGVEKLLALTGVRTIMRLRPFWEKHDCTFRILDREESRREAAEAGFPAGKIVYYHRGDDEGELLDAVRPDAIITKESGESGGFEAKVDAATERGVKVFAVKRPVLPARFVNVEGEITLRRAVERLVPDFFPLRSGLTTGTCATAAVTAALSGALGLDFDGVVGVTLPGGETVRLETCITGCCPGHATAQVVKDAGDDPDVTHGAVIVAEVTLSDRTEGDIRFHGGEGVGTVTLPGLGVEPGGPAINPVPRRMMSEAVRRLYPEGGVDITISVPGGRELWEKTFNNRVGVVDGISIIGTSGVVRPFSHEAFVEALTREVEVAVATGCDRLVMNSGAKSERSVRSVYPDLPPQAFVHYGNAIGETLAAAARCGIRQVTVGLMIGKAVKLAAGHLDTHSHKVAMDREFLVSLAAEAGCSEAAVKAAGTVDMARHLWDVMTGEDADRFFNALLDRSLAVCASVYPRRSTEGLLIDDNGVIRYRQ